MNVNLMLIPAYVNTPCEPHGCIVEIMMMTRNRGRLVIHDPAGPTGEYIGPRLQTLFVPEQVIEGKAFDIWGTIVRPWLEEQHAIPESAAVYVSEEGQVSGNHSTEERATPGDDESLHPGSEPRG